MSASKTSAVADDQEPIDVLFALHPKFDLLDFAGPVEVFTTALHDKKDPSMFSLSPSPSTPHLQARGQLCRRKMYILGGARPSADPPPASKAFEITLASEEPKVLSDQGIIIDSHMTFREAHEALENFDVLVVLGGNIDEAVKTDAQPAGLICDFRGLQQRDPARERTILSICTGSLFLAKEGILSGLAATTHPDHLTTFENLCSDAATRELQERTDVVDDARYVVNNLRFDLEGEDASPYIRRKSDSGRRPSAARYVPPLSLFGDASGGP